MPTEIVKTLHGAFIDIVFSDVAEVLLAESPFRFGV